MKLSVSSVAAALAVAAISTHGVAAATIDAMLIKESVTLPRGWERRSAAADDAVVPFRIALKQRGVKALEERLLETSDPLHPRYGQHLTRDEVNEFLSPTAESVDVVRRWLEEHGVAQNEDLQRRSAAGDWISVNVPVWKARDMLKADPAVYEHKRSGEHRLGALEYSLPRALHGHIDFVGPMTLFMEPRSDKTPVRLVEKLGPDFKLPSPDVTPDADRGAASGKPASCNTSAVTSQCLRDLYGTTGYVPKSVSKFFLGISGFLKEYANFADFQLFLTKERPDAASKYNFTVATVAGGLNDQSIPGVEANLDAQTVGGISYPLQFTYYSTAGSPPFNPDQATPSNTNEPYEVELNYLLGLGDSQLPKVLSTSYGDDEQTVPKDYAIRVCNQIMALGSRGVSMLYSSGDNGVGLDGACFSNGATAKNGTARFLPSFPASCPYATSVGATENFAPEQAVSAKIAGFYSGGGFSDYFAAPKYQAKVVSDYVKSLKGKFDGLYNKNGRGYPDISAQGSRYLIYVGGQASLVGGTSASSPTVASIVGLVNDARIAAGKPTLGFLNPLIYSKLLGSQAANDVTIGSAAGCNTTGFPAQAGWDAVSGVGTPNFKAALPVL